MRLLLALVGTLLVLLSAADALGTTIRVSRRGGPTSRVVSQALWSGLRRASAWRITHGFVPWAGPFITLSVIATWLVAMLVGWYALFSSSQHAVVSSTSGAAAGPWERLYFVSFTVFTLGIGDFRPSGTAWQLLTGLAGLSGLFLVTLAITYLMPLTGAVSHKRQVARQISAIGLTPQEILGKTWSGHGFHTLEQHLSTIAPQLTRLAEEHLAYPMLHYFQSRDRATAVEPSVASLDEALLLLQEVIAPDVAPPAAILDPARDAIEAYLHTLPGRYLNRAQGPPPPPDISSLRQRGIPVRCGRDVAALLGDHSDHRAKLLSLSVNGGWSWSAIGDEPDAG